MAREITGFDVNSWPKRTLENYMSSIRELKKAKTQTERDILESPLGVRFSKLCEIDYFDPVRMSIVDPMHNLFQGTAKKNDEIVARIKSYTSRSASHNSRKS